MKPFRIAVMYGSQTGNAQSIAEGVHDGCTQRGIESALLKCDGWKKMTPELQECSAVVFIVATTGNGDPPENAERFWRFIKRRTQPKDMLAGLPFALLGLGDTNYDKFCYMGKSFDKRLRELGAEPFHTPAFADEATNMEETIEPWLASLYLALETLRGGGNMDVTGDPKSGNGVGVVDGNGARAVIETGSKKDEKAVADIKQEAQITLSATESGVGNGTVTPVVPLQAENGINVTVSLSTIGSAPAAEVTQVVTAKVAETPSAGGPLHTSSTPLLNNDKAPATAEGASNGSSGLNSNAAMDRDDTEPAGLEAQGTLPSHRVAIMYGSQTGNAQSIAEGVHQGCSQRGFDSTLLACDGWKKMKPDLKEWTALVLVVATTGNGDPPENTERFWRFLKRRTQPKDLLEGLPFALLGLGDTNYDKFCHMGKSFDKRLRELGAVPFHPPAFADEATNMEETVEPWLASLYPALKTVVRSAGNGGVTDKEVAVDSLSPASTAVERPTTDSVLATKGSLAISAVSTTAGDNGDSGGANTGGEIAAQTTAVASVTAIGDSSSVSETTEKPLMPVVEAAVSSPKGNVLDSVLKPKAENLTGHISQVVAETVAVEVAAIQPVKHEQEAPGASSKSPGPHRIAVMYGSQTGNAQSIAEGVHQGCGKRGLDSTLLACNGWKKMTPELREWSALVLVVATTGNGDAPENTERFWRFLKRRTHPKDLLLGLPFALLGLGDTNYDKFCHMGKSFDKRLRELGAVPLYPPAFADEATNMEETVEPWLASLYPALQVLVAGSGVSGDAGGVSVVEATASAVSPVIVADTGDATVNSDQVIGRADVVMTDVSGAEALSAVQVTPIAAIATASCPTISTASSLGDNTMSTVDNTMEVISQGSKVSTSTTGDSLPGLPTAIVADIVKPADVPQASPTASAMSHAVEASPRSVGKADGDDAAAVAIRAAAAEAFQNMDSASTAAGLATATAVAPEVSATRADTSAAATALSSLSLSNTVSTEPTPELNAASSATGVPMMASPTTTDRAEPTMDGPPCDNPEASVVGATVVAEATVTTSVVMVPPLPWSPGAESGSVPLSDFLTDEQLSPGFAPAREDLPRLRRGASDVRFEGVRGGGAPGEGTGDENLWLRRARQRSSSLESRHTFDWPFSSRVLSARYLTEGGRDAERRVILMELSVQGSGITYEPGDVIGIRCPNSPNATAFLLDRLQVKLPESSGPDVPFHHSLTTLPSPCTLRDALSTRLDLQAPLRRPVIRALAEFCEDEREKAWMDLLCAKTSGADVHAKFVAAQSLTMCELLEAFPSCKPRAGPFLGLLPPLPPRYYSVASSQLATPGSLSVAFSVVSYSFPTSLDSGSGCVTRKGLCTNWLEDILTPFLVGNEGRVSNGGQAGATKGMVVPIFIKPTKEFLLPASAKWPCVLIGPGTGVSPFVGFLKHRQEQLAQRQENTDAVCSGYWRGGYEISLEGEEDETAAYRGREGRGDMWLFFGCRNEKQDWIFREEMEAFLSKGVLTRLSTAFSRDTADKVYVQHRIREAGAELSRLMLEDGAYVYVCGDGNAMAQGVHQALAQVLVEHGGVGDAEGAEAALRAMKAKNRYVLDVWS